MLEKLSFDIVLGILKRAWPFLIMAGLTISLAITADHLRGARAKLANEAEFRHALMGVLEYDKDDSAHLLYAAGTRMKESKDHAVALKTISDQALQNKQRADAADAELKREQADNEKKFAAARAQIANLQGHKSTGNREADWKQIDEDSQAAWKGWKQ
jgi:hypothetical protein